MATCPRGHHSATADYCDVCGTRIASPEPTGISPAPAGGPVGGPASVPAATDAAPGTPPAASRTCPQCGTVQSGRFCEVDGHDFVLATRPDPAPPSAARPDTARPDTARPDTAVPDTAVPGSATLGTGDAVPDSPALGTAAPGPASPVPAPVGVWHIEVGADRALFETVIGNGGADAGGLTFPRFVPPRRFQLTGEQMLIGRRSRSRGVAPDIDLTGPPEDPGVSHLHALLVAQPSGWAVVDLESANGTYLNDPRADPLPRHDPVPLRPGDRILLGAWTVLTVTAADPAT